jgi:hypothetical protein
MNTPFFPSLRAQLAALGQRTVQTLRQLDFLPLAEKLRQLLPPDLLQSEEEGPNSRDRIYSLRLTFECFVWQMLQPGAACREVVRAVQALFQSQGWGPVDEGTGGYTQARQRLPKERLQKALEATAATAHRRVDGQGQLQGRTVKAVDCSTAQMPDTPRNQERYPQPSSQKPGCGFPLMKFLVLYDLGSGAIVKTVMDHWKNHDLRLLRRVWGDLHKGDILLGDRAYADYVTLSCLPQQEVDVLARLPRTRKVDFRRPKQRLGRLDALFEWKKGWQQSEILTPQEWEKMPEKITVRILRFDAIIRGRKQRVTLVTTLLDPVAYPAEKLIALYARRWNLELALRHLKTTMGMEHLRCRTPEMCEKEVLVCLVAYNLIRCLMAEAVAVAGVQMERVSFKGAMDAVRQYTAALERARSKKKRRELWDDLVANIVKDLVPSRPGRREPRAVKRRPKPYPLLTKPRHQYREILHRSRYRKNKPSKKSVLHGL